MCLIYTRENHHQHQHLPIQQKGFQIYSWKIKTMTIKYHQPGSCKKSHLGRWFTYKSQVLSSPPLWGGGCPDPVLGDGGGGRTWPQGAGQP